MIYNLLVFCILNLFHTNSFFFESEATEKQISMQQETNSLVIYTLFRFTLLEEHNRLPKCVSGQDISFW